MGIFDNIYFKANDVVKIVRIFVDDIVGVLKDKEPKEEYLEELREALIGVLEEIKDNSDEDFIEYFQEILEKR